MVSIFLFTSQPIGRPVSGGGGKNENLPRPVRNKTFSTHITPEIHHVVRKSGVFTHEKVRPETSHASGRTDESINLICQVSIKR